MTESSQEASLLHVANAYYAYGANQVLTDVSFQVSAGEITALIGRNGAGKSTLLRCIAGWTQLKNGEIDINGISLRKFEREARQQLIFVPDTPPFYDDLTAWEHLQLVAQSHRLKVWKARAENLLHEFALWPQRMAFPFTFSRGMRYKLAVCMALLVEPGLLLLDEPFGPLDPLSMENLWQQLKQQCDQGMGILLSSHMMPDYAQPDRYLVMEQGEIILQGTEQELMGEGKKLRLDMLLRMALNGHEEDEVAE